MIRVLTIAMLAATAGACTLPTYEADPVSVYQWERRQEQIQRQQAERERLCRRLLKRPLDEAGDLAAFSVDE